MNITELLQKVIKGETLTDEEKTAIGSYNPQTAIDSAAGSARKEAEAKLLKVNEASAEMQKQIETLTAQNLAKQNEGQSENEKAQSQIVELSKRLEAQEDAMKAKDAAIATATRKSTIDSIRKANGIKFADGLDSGMLENHFATSFDGIDDLTNMDVIKPKVEAWRKLNAAAIVDTSGHGAGTTPGNPSDANTNAPVSMEARAKELADAGMN